MPKVTGPSNHHVRVLSRTLWKTQRPIWRDVSRRLMAPSKNRVEKNLGDINRIVHEGETVVIPGKVLANGSLTKHFTLACHAISASAQQKLDAAKIEWMTIEQLLERNPTGTGVRIII